MAERDYLGEILARKRLEVARRIRRVPIVDRLLALSPFESRGAPAIERLRRRPGERLRTIAEVKFRSPSAGVIRERRAGDPVSIARAYAEGGAAAISVLADGPGFGGSVLDVRRVAQAVSVPLLFKEFVLDEVQVRFARLAGASFVLLLVRALDDEALRKLVRVVQAEGMEPIVEAKDGGELDRALESGATVVGVNARDLGTFTVDTGAAATSLEATPDDRIAVFMSGVRTADDFARIQATRADAVLVGEGLMRAEDPGRRLVEIEGRA